MGVQIKSTSAGALIGKAATDKIGLYGATPIVQPTAAGQAAITDSTGGTPATTLAAIAAGAGYTQADAVAIKNALSSLNRQLDSIRTALVNLGLIKGS